MAKVYDHQGRYADAEPLYKRAVATGEKAHGPDHPLVAVSLNNLAALYTKQDRYTDAEPLLKRALAILEKALSPDHPYVVTALNNLAELYRKEGRYADALPLVQITIGRGRAKSSIALPVLFLAQRAGLTPPAKAQDDALDVAQRAAQSAAAAAVNKLAARLAAGTDRLASPCATTRISPPRTTPSTRRSLPPSRKSPPNAMLWPSSGSGIGSLRLRSSARRCRACSPPSFRTMRYCRTRSRWPPRRSRPCYTMMKPCCCMRPARMKATSSQ